MFHFIVFWFVCLLHFVQSEMSVFENNLKIRPPLNEGYFIVSQKHCHSYLWQLKGQLKKESFIFKTDSVVNQLYVIACSLREEIKDVFLPLICDMQPCCLITFNSD